MRFILCAAALVALVTVAASADETLKGIACRSVHFGYPAPEGVAFYTEMTVKKSADGTYFMAAGWSKGYFGIQGCQLVMLIALKNGATLALKNGPPY